MTLISTSNLYCSRFTSRLAAVLVAVGATACTIDKDLATVSDGDTATSTSPGDTSSGTTEPTGTTDDSSTGEPVLGCPDHPAIDDCCCFVKDDLGYPQTLCMAEQEVLCKWATFKCVDDGDDYINGECFSVDVEENADCAISALISQKPGTVNVRFDNGGDDNGGRGITYHIVGDGSVYRIDVAKFDFMGEVEDIGHFDLQPPSFFTACLAGTLAEKADCLREALSGEAQEICVPGFTFSDV